MFEKLNEYAIDIETLSTSRLNLPAIAEIGAVKFDRTTGEILDQLHERIDLNSAMSIGKVDADTLRFWFAQKNAEEVMNKGYRASIVDAFISLEMFFGREKEKRIWAWGAEFDLRVIMGTSETINHPFDGMDEIDYRTVRDARTYCTELSEHFGIILPTQEAHTKHHALDDARHCALLVSTVYQHMNKAAERSA